MDNEKILEDLFRSLRVSLTNAFSYSKDHPYFIKSVENFKVKLEEALAVLNPLKIGVTATGIVVEDKNLTKSGFYDELARQLHQRKIKSIEIRSGSTLRELIQFLSVISLPQKDIFKAGGVNAILKDEPFAHFTIEELDYSAFLRGQGQECNDIWGYMLKEAAQSKDTLKLEILADGFGPLIKRSSQKDVFQAEDVPSSIGEFLISLKEKNKEKFDKCSKDVFLWILNNKKSLKEDELEKLKPVFKSLNQEDFSNLLWEGISVEENFDDLSLKLFSKFSEQKNLPKMDGSFLNRLSVPERLKNNPNALKRVQDLLTGSGGDQLSPVYRNILESLMKEVSSAGRLFFDQKTLRQNYRHIVLNLFSINADADNLESATVALGKELPDIFQDQDWDFLKNLDDVLIKKKSENSKECSELKNKLSVYIENIVLNQSLPASGEFLVKMVLTPNRGVKDYLDKIFISQNPAKQILSLFFRLFPDQMDVFYLRLQQKFQDLDFLSGLVDILGRLEEPSALAVLEYIYTLANELIKGEILIAMRGFKNVNAGFILQQLNTNSLLLRKNLLAVLRSNKEGINAALDLLLKINSFWGSKNNLLIENMQIVLDLGIIEAASRIHDLAGRKFFWNKALRDKAKQVLGEWNES